MTWGNVPLQIINRFLNMYLDRNQPTDWLCNAQRNKEGVIQLNGLLGANFFTKLLHSTETAYSSQNGK